MVKVETLEHPGWGMAVDTETQYVHRWDFADEWEANHFVQSLYPRIARIGINLQEGLKTISQVRSGHRNAVRAQFRGKIVWMEVEIVLQTQIPEFVDHKLKGVPTPIALARPYFWSVENAWEWLANVRLDGKPVSRSNAGKVSEYLTQPFIKGNPEVVEMMYGQPKDNPRTLLVTDETIKQTIREMGGQA